MTEAAATNDFERAARWRDKFEQLEWLLAATSRARTAIDLLTFVYRDPGAYGDDRAYVVRRGVVRASYPWPETPIEREAFDGVVATEREQLAGPRVAPAARVARRDPSRVGLVPAAPGGASPHHAGWTSSTRSAIGQLTHRSADRTPQTGKQLSAALPDRA